MIKVTKDKTIYIFYEDFEYNKENPEDTIFGFDIRINCSGIPDFIYMVVKKKGSCKIITNGWEREYNYEDGILTQTYKSNNKKSSQVTTTKAEISEEKMKLIMEAMWNVYKEDWPKIIAKKQETAEKISQSKIKTNSDIPF